MQDLTNAFFQSFALIASGDSALWTIIALSLKVTLSAVAISCLIGMPAGAALAVFRFPGRKILTILTHAAMGLPPVVVGLGLYLMLSRSGPLGVLNLLYTPTAMIIAQVILITPIIAALSQSAIEDRNAQLAQTLTVLRATIWDKLGTLMWEARPQLMTAALAGMGRAFAEVGAVMIVGGNIHHLTRVMTTAIALETSRGALALAMALGIILLVISLVLNGIAMTLRPKPFEVAHGL